MWSVEDSRRWDSLRKRWSSRSFFRLDASDASSSSGVILALLWSRDGVVELEGGLEL